MRKDNGILNNPLYRGRVVWNRVKWVRSAADSTRRRQVPNPRSEWIEHQEERLRIVSEALWESVKARQQSQAHALGDRVKVTRRACALAERVCTREAQQSRVRDARKPRRVGDFESHDAAGCEVRVRR